MAEFVIDLEAPEEKWQELYAAIGRWEIPVVKAPTRETVIPVQTSAELEAEPIIALWLGTL